MAQLNNADPALPLDPLTPGYSVFVYSWPGQSWPECQCPSSASCRMDGANASATVTTRYVTGTGSGYLPGTELKIPLPMSGDVLGWSVKITWDIQTVENNILLTSNTKGGLSPLTDSIMSQR